MSGGEVVALFVAEKALAQYRGTSFEQSLKTAFEKITQGLKDRIESRWASVGGGEPLLCHPFPVTAEAALGYEGVCRSVLFHNGTWGNWENGQEIIGELDGPMSDSRAVAALVHHKGTKPLKKMPGRWAVTGSEEIELFGDWQP